MDEKKIYEVLRPVWIWLSSSQPFRGLQARPVANLTGLSKLECSVTIAPLIWGHNRGQLREPVVLFYSYDHFFPVSGDYSPVTS